MNRLLFTSFAVLALTGASAVAAPPAPAHTLQSATDVMNDLAALPLKGIPPALLAEAHGVAIIPHVMKAGFIVGGRTGHGVVLTRDRNGGWGEPTFVTIGGASVGFQVGVQSTDVVLVFRSRDSLERILEGKGKVTLGADASIAAGPVGRQALAATDAKLQAEIISYSRSRGLFAGVALDGAYLMNDKDTNAQFRADQRAEVKNLATALQIRVAEMSATTPKTPPPTLVPTPPAVIVPPPVTLPQKLPARPE